MPARGCDSSTAQYHVVEVSKIRSGVPIGFDSNPGKIRNDRLELSLSNRSGILISAGAIHIKTGLRQSDVVRSETGGGWRRLGNADFLPVTVKNQSRKAIPSLPSWSSRWKRKEPPYAADWLPRNCAGAKKATRGVIVGGRNAAAGIVTGGVIGRVLLGCTGTGISHGPSTSTRVEGAGRNSAAER